MDLIEYKDIKRYIKVPYNISKQLKGNELRLYLMLLEYYNKDFNYAYPTYKHISDYFGWKNKEIKKYLDGLVDKGLIAIDKHKNKTKADNNIYYIFIPNDSIKEITPTDIIEHKLNTIENEISKYNDSIVRFKDKNDIVQYLKTEIHLLEKEKESLLLQQKELI